jgi:hypothetical protein
VSHDTSDQQPASSGPGTDPAGQLGREIDVSVPHSARVWNYWLGGSDNFAADRAAGDAFVQTFPAIIDVTRASRAFLGRSVRYLAEEAGLDQFLDVGSGLPTAENTHEIAQRAAARARVVYIDNDPIVLAHARTLLAGGPPGATAYLDADLNDPESILTQAAATLDLHRPVGLILNAVMGHIADDARARTIVDRLMAGLCSGSYLSLCDGTESDEAGRHAQDEYNDSGAEAYHLRTPAKIAEFFTGLELIEPGLVTITRWRPDPELPLPPEMETFGGVGRKP